MYSWLLIVACIASSNACQVLPTEKQALADIISEFWNAHEHSIDRNDSNAISDWFVGYSSEEIYVHSIYPERSSFWESRDAVIDKETGYATAFGAYRSGASVIFTVGSNSEYTCQEAEDGTEVISVLASIHGAWHLEGGQAVQDILVEYSFVYDGRWICVKIDFLTVVREIEELTGEVSMIERVAVLEQIIAYLDALETAMNSGNGSIINDWFLGNAIEELVVIGPSEGYVWNSREEAIDEETGMYALGCAPYHHMKAIISIGANIRWSCDTMDGMNVVSAKAPVRYAFMSDEANGVDDLLDQYQFVQVQGMWRMKKQEQLMHHIQLNAGSVPQEILE